MEIEAAGKLKVYAFKFRLCEADSERFEAYIRRTGTKKYAIACRALMEFLDRQEEA